MPAGSLLKSLSLQASRKRFVEIKINVKFYFYTCGTSNGLWNPWRYTVTTNIGTEDPVKHRDKAFGENIYWLKVVDYFRKKISILYTWQGPKYASGRWMEIERYVKLFLSFLFLK